MPIICDYFAALLDLSKVVVVATDAGGAKRAGRFAECLNTSLAIIDKRRLSDSNVQQGLVVGNVKGLDAIIFDDEISTEGTLVSTVDTLRRAGVDNIYVGAIYPVLCGQAVENLSQTVISGIVVTNTVHIPVEKQISQLKQPLSVAPLFARAITHIHTGESVSALFKP